MGRGRRAAAIAAAVAAGTVGVGCATTLQNYDKVSLGMNSDQVLSVAGKPHGMFRMESTGQGTIVPMPAGKTETWFYKRGIVQFHEGKVVAKGQKLD